MAYFWVIRTNKRGRGIIGNSQFRYFARRTSLKNPHYLTTADYNVKWFETREEAETYLMQKAIIHGPIDCTVSRRKMHLERGKYDYWKNREALLR